METIILLLQGAGILFLIAMGIVALLCPIIIDHSFKENTGSGCINYWLTGAEAIGILATCSYSKDTSSDGFYEALGFLTIIIVISVIVARKKAKKCDVSGLGAFLVVVAQVLSPISIFFIFLMISSAIEALKGGKNEQRK